MRVEGSDRDPAVFHSEHSSSLCCSLMIPAGKRRWSGDDLSIKMVALPGLSQGWHRVHCRICFCLCFLLSFSSGQLSGNYLQICMGKGTIHIPLSLLLWQTPIVHHGRQVRKHSIATDVATLVRNIWEGKEKDLTTKSCSVPLPPSSQTASSSLLVLT